MVKHSCLKHVRDCFSHVDISLAGIKVSCHATKACSAVFKLRSLVFPRETGITFVTTTVTELSIWYVL